MNEPAITLNNVHQKPPDLITLDICDLHCFTSAAMLLLNTFLNLVFFVLLLIIIHEAICFHQTI